MTSVLALLVMAFLGRCVQVLATDGMSRDTRWHFGERAMLWALAAFVPASLALELLSRTGSLSPANFLRVLIAASFVAVVAVVASGRWRQLVPSMPRLEPRGIGLMCILIVSGLLSSVGSFDHLAGGRDPGTYHLIGALLGREGSLHKRDPVLGNIPVEAREAFFYWRHEEPQKSPGFYLGPDGATVEPRFYPLVPAWTAVLAPLLGGQRASAALPLAWSLAALAAIYLVMARWWSVRGALFASVVLLLCAPQLYFSRTLTSEMLRQWLLFSSLLLLTMAPSQHRMAALAGAALGLIPVAHLGSLLIAFPVAVCALYRQWTGEGRRELPFYLAFFSLWLWGCLHARLAYDATVPLVGTRVLVRPMDLGLAAVAGLVLLRIPVARLRSSAGKLRRMRVVAAGLVVAIALHAYFLRPHLPAANLEAAWDRINFPMLAWYLSPPLLGMAVAGAVLWTLGRARGHPFFFSLAATFTVILVTRKFIHGDHIWTMRRFLPEVIPCLLGFAAIAGDALWRWGRFRRAAAVGLALLIVGFEARVSLPVLDLNEYEGCSEYVNDLASLMRPLDIMVMEQSLPTVLAIGGLDLIHGRNVVIFKERSREQTGHLMQACRNWIAQGRKVFLVTPYARGPRLSDELAFRLHRTVRLQLPHLERTMVRVPRKIQTLGATVRVYAVVQWMASGFPAPPDGYVDVGYDDFGMVDGFYEPEIALGTLDTYRWSTRSASVLVPFFAPMEEAVLTLRVAAPRPGAQEPPRVQVEVSLNGRVIGQAACKPSLTELSLLVPGDALNIGYNEVRIEVTEGLGSQTLPTGEQKELGLWVDWVKLQPKSAWKTSGR